MSLVSQIKGLLWLLNFRNPMPYPKAYLTPQLALYTNTEH